MLDQSEYLPANNAQDRRIIPMHDPIPGVDLAYTVALHNRAMSNYLACRDYAHEAYVNGDQPGVDFFNDQAAQYLGAALNCSDQIVKTTRIRSN